MHQAGPWSRGSPADSYLYLAAFNHGIFFPQNKKIRSFIFQVIELSPFVSGALGIMQMRC